MAPSIRQQIDILLNNTRDEAVEHRIKLFIEDFKKYDTVRYETNGDDKWVIRMTKGKSNYQKTFDSVQPEIKTAIDRINALHAKRKSKADAKTAAKVKYRVGDHVVLRGKIKDGSDRIVKKFEVKKVIWSIKQNPVNILVLKQYEGPNNNRSLDRDDCKKYHIKYEPGLQVYSMMLNFQKIRKNIAK